MAERSLLHMEFEVLIKKDVFPKKKNKKSIKFYITTNKSLSVLKKGQPDPSLLILKISRDQQKFFPT